METTKMKCKNCEKPYTKESIFCGACGNKLAIQKEEGFPLNNSEPNSINENKSKQKEYTLKIKKAGNFTLLFGILKLFVSILLILSLVFKNEYSNNLYFSDVAVTLIVGILFVYFGRKLTEEPSRKTPKILWLLIIITGIVSIASLGQGGRPVITLLVLINSIMTLKRFNYVKSSMFFSIQHKKDGKKLALLTFGLTLILMIGISLDVSSLNKNNEVINIKELTIDKSDTHSEKIDNLYRNTKYNFQIRFPVGWKIETGDGIHIIQKATYQNSTISVMVKQLDIPEGIGFVSIKDAGSTKEFIDTVIEDVKSTSQDVEVLDFGETKIDNSPSYWLEYSMNYQVLDQKIRITNLIYFIAQGNTMYILNAGTLKEEYLTLKPIFQRAISSFVLEK